MFDELHKSMWEDFSRMEQEMERRFHMFDDLMERNRQEQVQEKKKEAAEASNQKDIESLS